MKLDTIRKTHILRFQNIGTARYALAHIKIVPVKWNTYWHLGLYLGKYQFCWVYLVILKWCVEWNRFISLVEGIVEISSIHCFSLKVLNGCYRYRAEWKGEFLILAEYLIMNVSPWSWIFKHFWGKGKIAEVIFGEILQMKDFTNLGYHRAANISILQPGRFSSPIRKIFLYHI